MSFESPLPPYNATDPTANFLNSSCLDLLMIELVPMAYRIVNEVDNAQQQENISLTVEGKEKAGSRSVSGKSAVSGAGTGVGVAGGGSMSGRRMDEEEERDAVFYRLEGLGYRVGQGLVERYILSFLSILRCLANLCQACVANGSHHL
jgi:hypothetical protein